ncbi:GlxA family transcriptional regulator [Luteimicrobium subarcticum]|uniref:AraC family transcriptional regulator with amidase-like domain n=1 Tax=Luteimicrobium subarcticum TaxID=620910 RepID=A0A2M8WU26_9MICO|nr:helix-turn-helix domain-containing protein [Luteimicrobium subarcticum]PJI94414.1 AraC family transcriptional regulator with amidase-like domain [Luteimicrobium subarcticum]
MDPSTVPPDRTAQPPEHTPAHRVAHRVVVLALPSALPMEVGMPFQVLADRDQAPYDVSLCGARPGPVATTGGFPLVAPAGLEALATADTVIVPASRPHGRPLAPEVLTALRDAHARGARVASICVGAFALAQAGLLDGRRATTHWLHAPELAARFPAVEVDPDVLYVDEGDVVTSAGMAAGIDLCLHLVRTDHGAAVANEVARLVVAAPHRDGGQAQFVPRSPEPERQTALAATRAWALARLDAPLTVADLARHARLSERTLTRAFTAETGTSPLRWLTTARVDRARALLETTALPFDVVAARCGLGTAMNLRLHLRRAIGVTPSEYRATFAPQPVLAR